MELPRSAEDTVAWTAEPNRHTRVREQPQHKHMSELKISLPWWDDDPLRVTLRIMGMDPRTPKNSPYRGLTLFLFLLPSLAIAVVGQLFVPRDVALTIAGAFLSVQLAPIWELLRRAFQSSLEFAREE